MQAARWIVVVHGHAQRLPVSGLHGCPIFRLALQLRSMAAVLALAAGRGAEAHGKPRIRRRLGTALQLRDLLFEYQHFLLKNAYPVGL